MDMNICFKHLAQQIIITVIRVQIISLEHYNMPMGQSSGNTADNGTIYKYSATSYRCMKCKRPGACE